MAPQLIRQMPDKLELFTTYHWVIGLKSIKNGLNGI